MIEMFFSIFKMFFEILKYPLFVVLIFIAIFTFSICLNIIIELVKGKRFKKGVRGKVKKAGFLRKIFIDTPHQYVLDMFDKDPDFFPYQGMIIFEGRQGSGKTISMVEFAMRMQTERPLAKCITNLSYKYENNKLRNWRKLMDYKNGIYGCNCYNGRASKLV